MVLSLRGNYLTQTNLPPVTCLPKPLTLGGRSQSYLSWRGLLWAALELLGNFLAETGRFH